MTDTTTYDAASLAAANARELAKCKEALAALVRVSASWLSRPVEEDGVICGWYRWCAYCGGGTHGEQSDDAHKPDCPWLRAKALVEGGAR